MHSTFPEGSRWHGGEQSGFVCQGERFGCCVQIPSAFTFWRCCSVRFSRVLENVWTSWSARHVMVCSERTTGLLLRAAEISLYKSAGAEGDIPFLGAALEFHSWMAPRSSCSHLVSCSALATLPVSWDIAGASKDLWQPRLLSKSGSGWTPADFL